MPRRGGSRQGGGGGGGGGGGSAHKSPTATMVEAIAKHKNFRGLVGYSVKALAKSVTDDKANAMEALRCGAVPALTYVMGKHHGDSSIFKYDWCLRYVHLFVPSFASLLITLRVACLGWRLRHQALLRGLGCYSEAAWRPSVCSQ